MDILAPTFLVQAGSGWGAHRFTPLGYDIIANRQDAFCLYDLAPPLITTARTSLHAAKQSPQKEVFNMKDLEKLGSKRGVVQQTVEEVVKSLVDDRLVECE